MDPQFSGMKPVFCVFPVNNTTYRPLCTIIVGNAYTIPLFNHAGTNFNMPEICNCTEQLKGDVATNQYNLCELMFTPSCLLILLCLFYTYFYPSEFPFSH